MTVDTINLIGYAFIGLALLSTWSLVGRRRARKPGRVLIRGVVLLTIGVIFMSYPKIITNCLDAFIVTATPEFTPAYTESALSTTVTATLIATPTKTQETGKDKLTSQEFDFINQNFFDAINRGDYNTAWNVLDPNFRTSIHPEGITGFINFWKGFEIHGVQIKPASNGKVLVTITVINIATGKSHQQTIEYTVNNETIFYAEEIK